MRAGEEENPEISGSKVMHGTAVAFGGRAALLFGPSRSGKSSLAMETNGNRSKPCI